MYCLKKVCKSLFWKLSSGIIITCWIGIYGQNPSSPSFKGLRRKIMWSPLSKGKCLPRLVFNCPGGWFGSVLEAGNSTLYAIDKKAPDFAEGLGFLRCVKEKQNIRKNDETPWIFKVYLSYHIKEGAVARPGFYRFFTNTPLGPHQDHQNRQDSEK